MVLSTTQKIMDDDWYQELEFYPQETRVKLLTLSVYNYEGNVAYVSNDVVVRFNETYNIDYLPNMDLALGWNLITEVPTDFNQPFYENFKYSHQTVFEVSITTAL